MIINATIFVQALNFLIAYWLLKKILLEPGYAFVEREINRVRNLQKEVVIHENMLTNKKNLKTQKWHDFYLSLQKNKPDLHKTFEKPIQIPIEQVSISRAEQSELVDTLKKVIVEKATHV